ncbi:MAG: hypothetical protein M0R46_13380 [Candidatus Muirbacterium halophilum]|nr:hypothetical protein [Candidatus Muirbacterium halophilum]MCK9476913.1 hypothetical protein [Candidatus Muirbacterium halophilum]
MLTQPVKNLYLDNYSSNTTIDNNYNSINKNSDLDNKISKNSPYDNLNKEFEDSVEISDEGKKSYENLSEEEQKQVEKLKQIDREVKAHEQAHLSAAGGIAVSGAEFSYQTGPDGQKYAVGGEVNIDTSKGKSPQETIRKAEQIRSAAMAPAKPSSTDFKVAAQANQMLQQAKLELAKEDNSYKKTEDFYKSSDLNNVDFIV